MPFISKSVWLPIGEAAEWWGMWLCPFLVAGDAVAMPRTLWWCADPWALQLFPEGPAAPCAVAFPLLSSHLLQTLCVQLGSSLFHEEPLPYLVYQPLPWQVQCVTQSRRTSRDSEVRAAVGARGCGGGTGQGLGLGTASDNQAAQSRTLGQGGQICAFPL